MPTESHIRIDEGIKRGPRKQVNRKPKAAASGLFVSQYPPELRTKAVEQSYERLARGETTDEIAASYGLPGRTLRHWLIDDPKADEARRALINGELVRTLDEMRTAEAPLPLARAREEFRAWSWVAERREYKVYGQRQHIELETQPLSTVDKELLGSAKELLDLFKARIEREKIAALQQKEEKTIESVSDSDAAVP